MEVTYHKTCYSIYFSQLRHHQEKANLPHYPIKFWLVEFEISDFETLGNWTFFPIAQIISLALWTPDQKDSKNWEPKMNVWDCCMITSILQSNTLQQFSIQFHNAKPLVEHHTDHHLWLQKWSISKYKCKPQVLGERRIRKRSIRVRMVLYSYSFYSTYYSHFPMGGKIFEDSP